MNVLLMFGVINWLLQGINSVFRHHLFHHIYHHAHHGSHLFRQLQENPCNNKEIFY